LVSGASQAGGAVKLEGQSAATPQQAPLCALQQKLFKQRCPCAHWSSALQGRPSGWRAAQLPEAQ
jgi:hypothetical protein